jgi:hypothetical protein
MRIDLVPPCCTGILSIMPYPLTAAYNGSKEALAQYSETLRLGLEPLNIKVITVLSGQVRTNLPTMPELGGSSIYKSLRPALEERTKVHQRICIYSGIQRVDSVNTGLTVRHREHHESRDLCSCIRKACYQHVAKTLVLERHKLYSNMGSIHICTQNCLRK